MRAIALSAEDDECRNWGRWCRDNDPQLGYPRRWSIPPGPADGPVERDKNYREQEEAEEHGYDERRACATDRLFGLWLAAAREGRGFHGKRMFLRLQAVYVLRHHLPDLEVREALRAMADLKEVQARSERVQRVA